jgi:hypothetical protein
MDRPLRTWLLSPTRIPSSLWCLSTLASHAYVRAPGPIEARELAAERFRKYAAAGRDATPQWSPCLDPDLVWCVEVVDRRFTVLRSPVVLTADEALAIAADSNHTPQPWDVRVPDPSLSETTSSRWSDLTGTAT